MTLRCRVLGHRWSQPQLNFDHNCTVASAIVSCQRWGCGALCWVTKELPDPDNPHGQRLDTERGLQE